MENVREDVIKLITESFNRNGYGADLIDVMELEFDSIEFVSLLIEIEAKFDIMVPYDLYLMENFKMVDKIVAIIEGELSKQQAEKAEV